MDAPEFAKFVEADSARLIAAVKKIGKVDGWWSSSQRRSNPALSQAWIASLRLTIASHGGGFALLSDFADVHPFGVCQFGHARRRNPHCAVDRALPERPRCRP
jgi:hypothetical protein